MKIVIYRFNYRKNDIVKSLNNSVTFTNAVLRYPTNHLNPIIRIDLGELTAPIQNTAYPLYNYAYIEEFNYRFYFIENIVAITNNIFDLYLHVDVLYTYIGKSNALLRGQNVFVERNENNYNRFIIDDRINFEYRNIINYYVPPNLITPDVGSLNTIKLKTLCDNATTDENFNVLVSVTTDVAPKPTGAFDISDLPYADYSSAYSKTVFDSDWLGNATYVLSRNQATLFLNELLVDDEKASYVKGIKVLPFVLDNSAAGLINTTGFIAYGSSLYTLPTGNLNVHARTGTYTVRLHKMSLSTYKPADFFESDGFVKLEAYIPYYGWLNLDLNAIINYDYLYVDYVINFDSLDITVMVLLDGKIFFTSKVEMGLDIPINTSNAYENTRKKQSNAIQAAIGNVTSILTFGIGAALCATPASGLGVGLMIGGVSGMGATIANQVSQGLQIFDYGTKNTTPSDGNLVFYDKLIIRKTTKIKANTLAGAWLSENGRPLKRNVTMSNITGYAELGKCDFSIGSTNEEKELVDLLMEGVHFPSTGGW